MISETALTPPALTSTPDSELSAAPVASPAAPNSLKATLRNIALSEQNLMRLLFKAWTFIIILSLLLAGAAIYIFILSQRVGTVVVVDKTTGVAVSVNNRTFGTTPATEVMPDRPGDKEMITAAKQFLNSVYLIDPVAKVRLKEAAAGLKMMTPLSAIKYGNYVEENRIWETQIAQSQSSSWVVKDENVKIESRNPIVVSVYGEQRLKKLEGGATKIEIKQVLVPVTLMADPEGRTERNFFTGFNPDAFGPEKVLSSSSEIQDSFTTKPQPAQR
jgi:hypothetical protein